MMKSKTISPLLNLFLHDIPLIDVRSPVEFLAGAFPLSVNLPILNDSERAAVGTCYKRKGPDAAMKLGHTIFSGSTKESRVGAWCDHLSVHPHAQLYCFRGGQRSGIACSFIQEALAGAGADETGGQAIAAPKIEGGYKAIRNALLPYLSPRPEDLILLSGSTGIGKTDLLITDPQAIDLEGAANHRGSSFGGTVVPQPTQINFENDVAIQFLKHQQIGHNLILIEDESCNIGRIGLPGTLRTAMKASRIVVLEGTFDDRVDRILDQYIIQQWQAYSVTYGENAFQRFTEYLFQSMGAIRKRLGDERYQALCKLLQGALDTQRIENSSSNIIMSNHRAWIEELLRNYYDPMYQYQLEKKKEKIVFKGTAEEVRQWLQYERSK
jgi:tRNA 2-selenouridine synthase